VRQRKIIIGKRKMTDTLTLLAVMYDYDLFIDYSKFSFGSMGQVHGLLIYEVSRSDTTTHHSR
jgi:hypothetical protein